MAERIILLYGPGSGLGKSTVGRSLTERLNAQAYSAEWIPEEAVSTHPAFQGYVASVQAGHADDTAALTESCQRFVAALSSLHTQAVVLDSILPCWDWLYSAGCPDREVAAFSRTLARMLEPPRPVLLFVEGNPDTALDRAIAGRR